jgi:hypothetical protein
VLEPCDAFERNHPHEPPHFYLGLLGTQMWRPPRGVGG